MAEPTLRELLKTTISYKDIIDGRNGKANGYLLPRFNTIKATGKPTEVYVEKELGSFAPIVVENTDAPKKDNKLEKKQLTLKRFATSVEVSQQYIKDSAVDYEQYLTELLTERLIRGVELQITSFGNSNPNVQAKDQMHLLSQGGNGFKSANTFGTIEFELVQKLSIPFFDANKKENSFWIFNSYPQVVNKAGNDCITYDNLPPGAVGRLLGIPIYMSELATTSDEKQLACVLVNPSAYTLVLGDIKIEQLEQGTNEAVRGVHVFKGEVWADGVLTNLNGRLAIEYA